MEKGRLEPFSDGVIAITIMVLELKVPHGTQWADLAALGPVFLSFVCVGNCWSNHHHMLPAVKHVSGGVLWANMHLVSYGLAIPLALFPFGYAWFAGALLVAMALMRLMPDRRIEKELHRSRRSVAEWA